MSHHLLLWRRSLTLLFNGNGSTVNTLYQWRFVLKCICTRLRYANRNNQLGQESGGVKLIICLLFVCDAALQVYINFLSEGSLSGKRKAYELVFFSRTCNTIHFFCAICRLVSTTWLSRYTALLFFSRVVIYAINLNKVKYQLNFCYKHRQANMH